MDYASIPLLSSDPNTRLAEICLTDNQELTFEFIENHKDIIDIHAFMDAVCHKSTRAYTNWNVAISVALNEYRFSISIEALNQAFIIACEHKSVAIMSILIEFAYSLTPLTIERALIVCRQFSDMLCMTIIKRWARLGHASDSPILLTPTSIAIGHTIHAKVSSNSKYPNTWDDDWNIRWLLNNHYSRLPGTSRTKQNPDPLSLNTRGQGITRNRGNKCLSPPDPSFSVTRELGIIRNRGNKCLSPPDLRDCGTDGNVEMVRAMLIEDPSQGGVYFCQGVLGDRPEVERLVHNEFGHTTRSWNQTPALEMAINDTHPFVIDMLMHIFKDRGGLDTWISIFNDMCERGKHDAVEFILTDCKYSPLSECGFTFNPDLVKAQQKIVTLLCATYREQVLKQFPDWVV